MDARTQPGSIPVHGEEAATAHAAEAPAPDFAAAFAAAPGINLVLAADAPRFTMLAASDERLAATLTTREETLGRPLFEVFSDDNPANAEQSGVSNLRASLETVLRTREPHRMAVQRYDLRRPDGTWEVRHWEPRNVPVLGPDGAVRYVVHHVEDVTEHVLRAEAHDRLRGEYAESEDSRRALADANERLLEQQLELELANQQLQDQAVELEQQADELQAVAVELEERTEAAEQDRDRVARGEAKYRALFESIDEGFAVVEMIVDGDGRATDYLFVEANPAFVQQTGLTGAIGRTIRELVPDIEAHWIERYGRVAATGEPTRFQSESGVMGRWFDAFAFRVGPSEERRVALLFSDVTAQHATDRERERLLRELEVERARLAYVFQRAPSFLAILRGRDYVFELANDAYYQLVGHRELVGRPVWEALPEVRGQGFETLLDTVVETGEPFIGREVAVRLQRTPGAPAEERYVDLAYMPLVEADGTRTGVIAHGSDVTEQVEARRDVERLLAESERARLDAEAARAEAQTANRAKGEFLAVMSHELRTPLNAIGGYAELIDLGIRGPVTAEQRDDLARIQKSQRHLLGLINGVLNYSRAEAGAVHYELRDVALGPVLATCETLIATQARAKRIAVHFTACDGPLTVRADAEKLQQIVVNLLSNAVKFTDGGGEVTVACRRAELANGESAVVVTVTDTGRGIAKAELERIFEPFVQVDTRLTRTEEGIGLGLAISRDLARGMGGDIAVTSSPGVGSTFALTLPAA